MRVVRWLTRYVALLSVVALPGAGCSHQRDNRTADATTSSLSTAPAAFEAEVRAMSFGTKDLAAASDGCARDGGTEAIGGAPDHH